MFASADCDRADVQPCHDQGAGMIIYGGANATRQFNDLWTFDLLDHMWTRLPPEGPAPPVETQIEPQAFRAPWPRRCSA